ncbi:MAG: PASTA domain-containing protein, partial [Symbiobacteriaceae bacterium]
GFKCFATDGPAPELAAGAPPGAHYEYFGDEHGRIVFANDGDSLPVGAAVELVLGPRSGETVTVPDFRGLTLADAGRLAAGLGLLLKQGGGAGFVVEQSPAPGTAVPSGSVVTVRLSTVRP